MSVKSTVAAVVLVGIWVVGGILLSSSHVAVAPAAPQAAAAPANSSVATTNPFPAGTDRHLETIRANLNADLATLKNDAEANYASPETQALLHRVLAQASEAPDTAALAINLILRKRDAEKFKKDLIDLERSGPARLKSDVVTVLLTLPGTEGLAYAIKYRHDADATLRQTVVHELAERHDKADLPVTVPMLMEALQDKTPLIRKIAGNALRQIAGHDFKYDYAKPAANTQAIASIRTWAKATGYSVN
ncbi:MAG: HEAT repeat domain-containing protein [Rhodanobacteraceae bacterium]